MRRWIFSALGVLAVCLLMAGLDARAGDLQMSPYWRERPGAS